MDKAQLLDGAPSSHFNRRIHKPLELSSAFTQEVFRQAATWGYTFSCIVADSCILTTASERLVPVFHPLAPSGFTSTPLELVAAAGMLESLAIELEGQGFFFYTNQFVCAALT